MEIEEFQDSFKNKNIDINPYIIVVSIFVGIIFLIMLFNSRIKDYYISNALVEDNKLIIMVDNNELTEITSNDEIIIERNMFTYKVEEISSLSETESSYNKVFISVEGLDENLLIENNVINFKIVISDMSIFEYILKVVKGE